MHPTPTNPDHSRHFPKIGNVIPKGTSRWALSALISAGALLGGTYLLLSHDRGTQKPPIQPVTPASDTFNRPDSGVGVIIPQETALPTEIPTIADVAALATKEAKADAAMNRSETRAARLDNISALTAPTVVTAISTMHPTTTSPK